MSELVSHLAEARARQALRGSCLPYKGSLTAASSTHNEIHLSEQHVIRVSTELNDRLRREGQLYDYLPNADWGPSLVAAGNRSGTDYLIVDRKKGQPLAHTWPFLNVESRRRAITQLADCMKVLHNTPAPSPEDVPPLNETMYLLNIDVGQNGETDRLGARVAPLLDGLARLGTDANADSGVIAMARDYVTTHAHHLDDYDDHFLIHGDLTFENVLFDQQAISAIVDFEWCRGAPMDVDLDVLLRCCAMPKAHVAAQFEGLTRPEDYESVPVWLAEDYPELFSRAGLVERLTLHSLAFDVQDALSAPLPEHRIDVDDLHPYNRLINLVSTGGHVALVLERVGLSV